MVQFVTSPGYQPQPLPDPVQEAMATATGSYVKPAPDTMRGLLMAKASDWGLPPRFGRHAANIADITGVGETYDLIQRERFNQAAPWEYPLTAAGLIPAGKPVAATARTASRALPSRRTLGKAFDVLEDIPVTHKGKDVAKWTADDFAEYGRKHGVKNLGPGTPGQTYKYMDGGDFTIPGGTEGTFTYYDLLQLKSQGIDASRIDPQLHTQIQAKLGRTMMGGTDTEAGLFNSLVFGMTSPNNPLFPNQMAASRLRPRSKEDVDRLADMVPWEVGAKVDEKTRLALDAKIAKTFGIDEGKKGGLGVRGSADYTRVAEMAKLFRDDPEWFRLKPNEEWIDYVERLSSQVAGLGSKTASFSAVWQDPLHAAVSAIDRHMAFIMKDKLWKTAADRRDFDKKVVLRWNRKVGARRQRDAELAQGLLSEDQYRKAVETLPASDAKMARGVNQILAQPGGDGHLGGQLLNLMKSNKRKLNLKKGGRNPNISKALQETDWLFEPEEVQMLGREYLAALKENERLAKKDGLHLFMSQWKHWDRQRRRLEPHENMFPGLENLPPMSQEQAAASVRTMRETGHLNYGKEGGLLQPTKPLSNPARAAYWSVPPAAGLLGLGAASQQGEEPQPGM